MQSQVSNLYLRSLVFWRSAYFPLNRRQIACCNKFSSCLFYFSIHLTTRLLIRKQTSRSANPTEVRLYINFLKPVFFALTSIKHLNKFFLPFISVLLIAFQPSQNRPINLCGHFLSLTMSNSPPIDSPPKHAPRTSNPSRLQHSPSLPNIRSVILSSLLPIC